MSFTRYQAPGSMTGFSLLEVLIAGTVFSIGLAGLAALLLANIISSAEARNESTAAVMAANLAEQIRLNPLAVNQFVNPPEYVSRLCMGTVHCTPELQADYDFKLWRLELADYIHDASGIVCRDATPQDGDAESHQCDGDGPLVIKIFWSGRIKASSQQDNQQAGQHRLTFEVG